MTGISKIVVLAIGLLGLAKAAAPAFCFGSGTPGYYSLGSGQGLAGESVGAILQDRRGHMWFGATGGISRYDGHSFSTFRPRFDGTSFLSSRVLALVEDRTGLLWIGTDGGGISSFNPDSGQFRSYTTENGLRTVRITALSMDGLGRLLVGGAGGSLDRYEPSTDRFLPFTYHQAISVRINGILRDLQGRIWVATEGSGLELYGDDGQRLAIYRHGKRDPGSIASDTVTALFEDSLGSLWAGTGDGSVDLFREGRFSHSTGSDAVVSRQRINAIAEDPEGKLWIGYQNSRMGFVDPANLGKSTLQSVESSPVLSLYRDRGGLMWAGLENGGLRVYNLRTSSFSRIVRNDSSGRPESITGLAVLPDGRVIARTGKFGMAIPDRGTRSFLTLEGFTVPGSGSGSGSGSDSGIGEPSGGPLLACGDGSILAGTAKGLCRFGQDRTMVFFRHDYSDPTSVAANRVISLYEDRDGSVWVGLGNAGLDLYDPARGTFTHHALAFDTSGDQSDAESEKRDPMAGKMTGPVAIAPSVTAIIRDSSGRLWVGTGEAGLWRLDPGTERFVALAAGRGEPSPVGDSYITALFEDRSGNIWVGTGGAGLVRLDPESGAFVHYGDKEGFYGDRVQAIAEDRAGILWIASSDGLYSYDRNMGDFFCFGAEDGLVPGAFSPGALVVAGDGSVWAGGSGGLTVFDPAAIPRYSPQPEIAISGSIVGNGEGKALSSGENPLVIRYDNRGLDFSISVIDYTAPSRNRYAMKLEGRQEDWTFLGRNNSGFIAPLAPGRYTLRVKGANGNGIWNNYGASLSILVTPPFWATWWFRLLAALFVLTLLSLGILARIISLRKRNRLLVGFSRHIEEAREEERRIAAREVHDEIGQHLTVLNFNAYWLASHPDADRKESMTRIEDMRKGILDAMNSVKSVATKLRPAVLDTLDFTGAMRWYVGNFARLSEMEVFHSVSEGIMIPAGELATALFRILQEMLGNVMRHSGARRVEISLAGDEAGYVLAVRDDGKGMDPGAATSPDSFGIIGMKERCSAFGGVLEIVTSPGQGTTVRARIPKRA